MAIVYTPEAVAQGALPTDGEHDQAIGMLMGELAMLAESGPGTIVGAMEYGSSAQRGVRSDLDVFVQYDTLGLDVPLFAMVHAIGRRVCRATGVMIDLHVASRDEIACGLDEIAADPLFSHYLRETAQTSQRVLGDPTAGLRSLRDYPRAQLIGLAIHNVGVYVSDKKRALGVPLIADKLDIGRLQRAYEIVGAIGRKSLMMHAIIQDGADAKAPSSRREVEQRLLEMHDGDQAWVRAITQLRQYDDDYTELLWRAIRQEITPEQYEARLQAVWRDVQNAALDFALLSGDEVVKLAKEHGVTLDVQSAKRARRRT